MDRVIAARWWPEGREHAMSTKEKASPGATGKHTQNSLNGASNVSADIFVADHPRKKRQIDKDVPIEIVPILAGGCVVGHLCPTERPPKRKLKYKPGSHRRREIEKVFKHLFPIEEGVVPTRAEARAFAIVIADHATQAEAFGWISKNLALELPPDEVLAIVTNARMRSWKADELAKFLAVTKEIRDQLQLRTIGATDFNKRQRIADRKRKARLRMRAVRARQQAGKSRPISVAESKPWELENISRASWYRRRAARIAADETTSVRNTNKENRAHKISLIAAILEALADGVRSVPELNQATGFPCTTIRPILSRLKAVGIVDQPRHGLWQSSKPAAGGPLAAAQDRNTVSKYRIEGDEACGVD